MDISVIKTNILWIVDMMSIKSLLRHPTATLITLTQRIDIHKKTHHIELLLLCCFEGKKFNVGNIIARFATF